MCGYPVEDNAYAVLVAVVDEFHEIVGSAEAGSGGIVAYSLISPGAVERELRHRHHLDVGVAHFLHIRNKLLSALHVVEQFFLEVLVLP